MAIDVMRIVANDAATSAQSAVVNEPDYHCAKPFRADVVEWPNGLCSGSPRVMGRDGFAGYRKFAPGSIFHTGTSRFTFAPEEGQELLVYRGSDPSAAPPPFAELQRCRY